MAPSNRRDRNERESTGKQLCDGGSAALGYRSGHPAQRVLRLTAFWTAVVLPFVALAVLVTGIESTAEWGLFGGIVVSNVVSLYVGHPYKVR